MVPENLAPASRSLAPSRQERLLRLLFPMGGAVLLAGILPWLGLALVVSGDLPLQDWTPAVAVAFLAAWVGVFAAGLRVPREVDPR